MQMIDDGRRSDARQPGTTMRVWRKNEAQRYRGLIVATAALVMLAPPAAGAADERPIKTWSPPFDYAAASHRISYEFRRAASRPWTFCVSYPHLKDAYWLSVNFGMVEEASRLGIGFRLVEAGGYPNLSNQIAQIKDCIKGADALIVGTVSFGGLTGELTEIAKSIPVIATVNDIDDPGISAKIGVSWVEMGEKTGAYLAARHPAGTKPVRIALFPGPEGPEWVDFELDGFRRALTDSAVEIVAIRRGDTGKEIQRNLVEEVLETDRDIDYIVGTSVTAEAAVGVLRQLDLQDKIRIVSFYFTHGVYRGIKRGRILAAPTDRPVLQGRLSIDLAVRVLEGDLPYKHVGPEIITVDRSNIDKVDPRLSLAPASFAPVFELKPRETKTRVRR